jgi:hypothetical protein
MGCEIQDQDNIPISNFNYISWGTISYDEYEIQISILKLKWLARSVLMIYKVV